MPESPEHPEKQTVETVQQTTETLSKFVQWIAELIRRRNWFTLLLLINVVLILFCTPGGIVPQFLNSAFSFQLPEFYSSIFWVVVGVIFLAAIAVAVITMPPLSKDTAQTPVERQAIKGLLSFTATDAEIFSQLERNQDIKNCLRILNDANFRIGILWGESGCGKTSFLQAGLIPELTKIDRDQGIYIQFSDKDPLITIKKTLNRELNLNLSIEEIEQLDLIDVFNESIRIAEKSLILFFDQFEQFFVHYQSADARHPFINALKNWYQNEEIPVKILMSFRSDLFYQQYEIQQFLDYSLDSKNNIKLKKFSVEQATNVLEVIANTENIEFERKDIQSFVEQELIDQGKDKSDEPISPVDIQILSLVIGNQKTTENRKFDKIALNKIGRFEGLLYQYLEERLTLREQSATAAQKEAIMKLLLELIDSNGLTRSGSFTLVQLQEKLGTMGTKEVKDAIRWLEQERLIMPLRHEDETVYQLAHERMIPAVLKLSGKILPKAYKANELLNKQVKIWIDSNYNPRYLLNLRELWLIEQQKSYLMWGDRQPQKERLIQKSKRRIYRNFGIFGAIVVLVMGIWGWFNHTTTGQLTQIRWKLANTTQQSSANSQAQAVAAFAKDRQFDKATKFANSIQNSSSKASALSAIAVAIGKLNQLPDAQKLLGQALKAAESLEDSSYKASALTAIAVAYGKLNQLPDAQKLLGQALKAAESIIQDSSSKASALTAIAEAIGKLNQLPEAQNLLQQALMAAESLENSYFKADALRAIAVAYGKLNQLPEAQNLLQQALMAANSIQNLSDKAYALRAIAVAYGKLNQLPEAQKLLGQALMAANSIQNSSDKAYALREIAVAYGKLNQLPEAQKLLGQALMAANSIQNSSDKAYALREIAVAYGKLNQLPDAQKLLGQALMAAESLEDSDSKANALIAIAEAEANLKNWGQALKATQKCPSKDCEVESLAKVLTVYAEQVHPELKEEEKEE
ncbi:tetratricopeptide repeat protein [Crocosphaera sp. XPORK-15E]|uniref:nSTAND1 domain-containing NTPase n=1 Tax=Crocosphaera sp. XPORK-15E TaxID=3110247 RepID=UPI002B2102A7|nr:tetratricopeptide repeat protein [Crocosphaera sp. XPORK-15E]MEA5533593.1 tetratricopeptide repeat protein [Crocosphaera sp. XPORK-15E]